MFSKNLIQKINNILPGLAVIGEHGLAASRPMGTAIAVSGVALARPIATAIAGVDPSQLGISYQINKSIQ